MNSDTLKNLVFEISHCNWGMMYTGCWESTKFKIYNDLTLKIKDKYYETKDSPNGIETEKIEKEDLDLLIELVDKAKEDNTKVDACDGDAWEFIYYKDNTIDWKREEDYIYGIEPLEKMAKIMEKYHNVN